MSYFIMASEPRRDEPDWPNTLVGPFDSFEQAEEWASANLLMPNWIIAPPHPKEVN